MSGLANRIADNLARVRGRMADAAGRSGRPAESVALVAVTKYVGPAEVEALLAAGCPDIGESRPQELWRKADALAGRPIRWHMVGHLQRNKVRRTLPLVSMVHSGDSRRLLQELDRVSAEMGRETSVLLEVNISGDQTKHGLAPGEVESLLPEVAQLAHLRIKGLMAMASREGDLDVARDDFARLRQLRDRLKENCPPAISLDELSMGMSGDFEVAIEQGATIVRIGSALFEGITG